MLMFFLSLLLSSLAQSQFNGSSWTCGVFIAGDQNEIPLAKFYEIPSQKASCPAKFRDTWRKGKFSKKCGKMVRYRQTGPELARAKSSSIQRYKQLNILGFKI